MLCWLLGRDQGAFIINGCCIIEIAWDGSPLFLAFAQHMKIIISTRSNELAELRLCPCGVKCKCSATLSGFGLLQNGQFRTMQHSADI
jgi:hypothetical protein